MPISTRLSQVIQVVQVVQVAQNAERTEERRKNICQGILDRPQN
jgi:hypothetical protein